MYLYLSAKLPPKGVDLEALGINGLEAEPEVEADIFEDKPWRKPGEDPVTQRERVTLGEG